MRYQPKHSKEPKFKKGWTIPLIVVGILLATAAIAMAATVTSGQLYTLTANDDGSLTFTPYSGETPTPSESPTVPWTPTPDPTPTVTPTTTPTTTPTPTPVPTGNVVTIPAGTYTGSFSYPDGTTIIGDGSDKTWLKGIIQFGSNQKYIGLKIGDYGKNAVRNKSGAFNTTFEDCHFRGGGGPAWTDVILLGRTGPAKNITFRRCEVECNLGTENRSMTGGYNDVTIWCASNSPVSDILFEDVHIGVSNGTRTGAPRMGVECYTDDSGGGWKNITFRRCIVEVCDGHGMDFSDESNTRSTGLLVEDCYLKGGGKAAREWGSTIDLEYPLQSVIRNNVFGMGWERVVQMTTRGDPYTPSYTTFTNNRIDLTPNGVPKASYWRAVDVTPDSPWGPTNTGS